MICGLAIVFTLLLVTPALKAGAEPLSSDKTQQIDRIVEHFREVQSAGDATLPAISMSIGVDSSLALAKGYGASDGRPVTEHTLYEIGSVTKEFTAAAVLEMIRSGATTAQSRTKISTSTPLEDVFGKANCWTSQSWLTVGRLLSMTSDLPNFTRRPPDDADPWKPIAAAHLLEDIEALEPPMPSNDFDYSNTNYFLLAEAIEQLLPPGEPVPQSYHDFLRKKIFRPAGMSSTGFIDDKQFYHDPEAPAFDSAQPISAALDAPQGVALASPDYRQRRRPPFIHPDWLKGSADMVSSATDLFAWNKALMDAKVIPGEVRDQMFSDAARVTPLIYYGMGWFSEHKDGRDIYSHSGAVPGYTSYNVIIRLKDNSRWVSITLLSNFDQLEGLDALADNIADIILQ